MSSFFTHAEIEKVQKILGEPTIEIVLKPEWGAAQEEHREKIKIALSGISCADSSISHCEKMGGFAYLNCDHVKIGLDVEESTRITPEVVRRVCKTQEELERAPSSDFLWAAKEAAFKSLKGQQQPKVISGIEIVNWSQKEESLWSFSTRGDQSKGVVLTKQSFVISLSLKK